ncbi:MAG: S-adenosyl-l-methionine hydroxide adenosyltransferase family protein [Spirochaetales bacterium]
MSQALVFQTDFGLADGAVSAMQGVAYQVDPQLNLNNLTHEIPQYDIWEASYRLVQTISYWPAGTVFVSVVDPGVGSQRRSLVARTKGGQLVVTPDNGTLTHIKLLLGLEKAWVLDEASNRLAGSELSYTFHGRDVYAFTGARLASGQLAPEAVGPEVPIDSVIELDHLPATFDDGAVRGTVDTLDVRFGSLWSNIPHTLFQKLGIGYGDRVEVSIRNDTRELYRNSMVFVKSFASVHVGEPLVYINSLLNVAVAINQGSFARAYNIGTGLSWKLSLRKSDR